MAHHLMLLLAAFCFLSTMAESNIAEVKLFLSDPPGRAILLGVHLQGSVIVNCTGPGNNISWLHNGKHTEASHVSITKAEGFSVLSIVHYNVIRHDGLWECFSGSYSASVRLDGDEEVPLQNGHRECLGAEYSFCDHAKACHVDPAGDKICFCKKGWTGARCEHADLDVSKSTFPTQCDGYQIAVVSLSALSLVLVIWLLVQYNKNSKAKTSNGDLSPSRMEANSPLNGHCEHS